MKEIIIKVNTEDWKVFCETGSIPWTQITDLEKERYNNLIEKFQSIFVRELNILAQKSDN